LETNDNYRELYLKYLDGQCTKQELDSLFSYFGTANELELQELIRSEMAKADTAPASATEQQMLDRIHINLAAQLFEGNRPERSRIITLWPKIAAAASVILCLSVGGYFLLHKKPAQQTAQNQNDIAPGSNKAILKLANGKRLVITDAKNGLLVQQGNTTITKTANGQLAYSSTATNLKGAMLYDTLIVPRGGQHQVRFADGSIAYLNADTKLRIPENFQGSDRTVELISGEADFHVVHNAKTPFIVKAKGQITKDIGTEFNVNAYSDEPAIKTTLLEGSVKVSKNNQSITLQPGQQALVQASLTGIKVNNVDTDEAFAWKNGKFLFSSTPLGNIMRQLSRWYDVDVVYQDEALKSKPFSAISTRFTNVSQVLHDLELTGDVKFKIEGKTIKVLNK
jgi:hypothetical protein